MSAEADETAERGDKSQAVEARVQRGPEGDPLGAALFVTAEELTMLGVNLDRRNGVTHYVERGQLRVE